MSNELLTGEVAKALGVCRQRVLQLERTGKLAARRIGRGLRLFDPASVSRLIEQRAKKKRKK